MKRCEQKHTHKPPNWRQQKEHPFWIRHPFSIMSKTQTTFPCTAHTEKNKTSSHTQRWNTSSFTFRLSSDTEIRSRSTNQHKVGNCFSFKSLSVLLVSYKLWKLFGMATQQHKLRTLSGAPAMKRRIHKQNREVGGLGGGGGGRQEPIHRNPRKTLK